MDKHKHHFKDKHKHKNKTGVRLSNVLLIWNSLCKRMCLCKRIFRQLHHTRWPRRSTEQIQGRIED
jgi:hypothetical protein